MKQPQWVDELPLQDRPLQRHCRPLFLIPESSSAYLLQRHKNHISSLQVSDSDVKAGLWSFSFVRITAFCSQSVFRSFGKFQQHTMAAVEERWKWMKAEAGNKKQQIAAHMRGVILSAENKYERGRILIAICRVQTVLLCGGPLKGLLSISRL